MESGAQNVAALSRPDALLPLVRLSAILCAMKTVAAKRPARRVVALGQYIVSDSAICHGAVTFKGTRCLVADALELLAEGLAPREVCAQMHGWIEPAAVLEAVRLAKDHFLDRHSKLRVARRKAA